MATYTITSPVDGTAYHTGDLNTPQDIDATLIRSENARKVWAKTPLAERKKLVLNMASELQKMADVLGKDIAHQMGRPFAYAKNEVNGFVERVSYLADVAEQGLSNHTPDSPDGFDWFVAKEPLGTLAVLSPWNYPLLTASNIIGAGLLAGNAIVLKHSTQTALIGEHLKTASEKAGFPEGVFQILHLSHADTSTFVADDRVHGVFFTGSVEGGKKIQQALTDKFVPCGLELGGKDPAYVRADADVDYAVENLVDGSFFNSGQSCCGIERIYVHADVYDDFVQKFATLTKDYVLGNPMDEKTTMGPMVKVSAADYVRQQVKDAVASGAKALIDESHFPESKTGTAYLAPQVLVDVDHSMDVMTQESFGPVVGIMPVKNDDEAIALMNDSDLGLTASVWTSDMETARDILPQLETGTAFVNRCDYLSPALAWTGVKNTGRGISLSVLSFDHVTRAKSYHIKHTL